MTCSACILVTFSSCMILSSACTLESDLLCTWSLSASYSTFLCDSLVSSSTICLWALSNCWLSSFDLSLRNKYMYMNNIKYQLYTCVQNTVACAQASIANGSMDYNTDIIMHKYSFKAVCHATPLPSIPRTCIYGTVTTLHWLMPYLSNSDLVVWSVFNLLLSLSTSTSTLLHTATHLCYWTKISLDY